MKKNLFILMALLALFSLVSCSSVKSKNDGAGSVLATSPEKQIDYASINQYIVITKEYPAVLDKLGTLEKVYTSADEAGKTGERFWSDGSMKYMAYYAEYTDLKPEVLSFFELQEYNCEKQGDYHFTEDPEKLYIEYIQFTPMMDTNGEYQEVRYIEDPEKKKNPSAIWYGKYFSFGVNEDFWDILGQKTAMSLPEEQIDYNGINQDAAITKENPDVVITKENPDVVITKEYPAVLDKLGTLENVYAPTDESRKADSAEYMAYYAEYTDLNSEVLSFFEPQEYNCEKQGDYHFTEDPGKFYIEYIQFTPITGTNGEYQEVRYIDVSGKSKKTSSVGNGKHFSFDLDEDFWDLLYSLNYGNQSDEEQKRSSGYGPADSSLRALKLSEYPFALVKFGRLTGVYAIVNENDSIVESVKPEMDRKTVSYFAEYTSLDPRILSSFMTNGYGALFRSYGNGLCPATLYNRVPSRYYIQLTVDESLLYPDYQEYDLRYLSDPSLIGSGEYFAKCITVGSDIVKRVPGSDLYDYICRYRH